MRSKAKAWARRPGVGRIGAFLAASAVLLAACGGGTHASAPSHAASGKVGGVTVKGLYGALPTSGTPTGTGTISMGQLSGTTPTYLLPIVPGANATDGTVFLINQLWLPLYNLQVGGAPVVNEATSAADTPRFSDGDKTVTIPIKPGLEWSDGQPVTARDVLFDIDLIKAAVKESADNWSAYVPGLFPDNLVSATAPSQKTLVLRFKRAYNPSYIVGDQLAYNIYPLPSQTWDVASANGPHLDWQVPANATRIYNYLAKQGGKLATFTTNPLWKVTDGPFRLASFDVTNSSFTLDANHGYSLSGKPDYAKLEVESFTGITPQLNALRSGALDVGTVDFSQLGDVGALRNDGYKVFGYPNIGSFGAVLNFKDTTDHFNKVIAQLYARQALAHLEDQPAYISGIYKGAAAPAYGPLPTIPSTPYTPANAGVAPYPYSISAASKLLSDHGWKVVPNGQSTCVKPGTGSGECGAGIPAGTPFKFTWFSLPAGETVSSGLESEAFASAAKQVGIDITLGTKTFNYQIQYFNDTNPANAKYTNTWGAANWGEYGTQPYPTQNSIFNSTGTENLGAYSDPTANKLINDAVYGSDPAAATQVATYLSKDVPMLFFPCADVIDAVSNKIGGTTDSWLALTQDAFYPQYWYIKK